jgi:hypothetical protein
MRNILVVSLFLSALISCSKDKDETNMYPLNGTYSGTFKRYNQPEDKTADVSLVFNKNNWTGSSNFSKYPALNQGTYTMHDLDALIFKNTAPWTADFDWTFILDGMYILHLNGDSLIFTKSYGNGAVDVYKLKKQAQ